MDPTAPHGSCRNRRSRIRVVSVLGLSAVLMTGTASVLQAANLTLSPGIALTEHHFDNRGEAFAASPSFDYVTELAPSIFAHAKGSRVTADLQYQLQEFIYNGASDLNGNSQQLLAAARTELVRDFLFLDLRSSRSQQVIDPAQLVTFENVTPNSNRTDVTTYQATPSIVHKFGERADFLASVDYADVKYSQEENADSKTLSYFADLKSGSAPSRFRWETSYRKGSLSRSDSTDQNTTTALVTLGYDVGPDLTALGSVGYEKTDLYTTSGDNSGAYWSLGAEWKPLARTSLKATAGRRYFGNSYLFNLKHRQMLNEWTINYSENFTNPAETALSNTVFDTTSSSSGTADSTNGTSQDGSTIVTGTVPDIIEPRGAAAITFGQYLSKRLTAGFIRHGARTTLRINAYNENRQYQIDGADERAYGGNISWLWAFGARTSSNLSGEWERQSLLETDGKDDDIWSARLEFVHQMSRRSYGRLGFRHTRRDSPLPATSYEQDVVTLGVSLQM